MIYQCLYWPVIRYAVRKEIINCGTFQCTKGSNKLYSGLPIKEVDKLPWNKICVDMIRPYGISRKGKKDNLVLQAITMIYPVTGWFKITQYENNGAISIMNLVETMWLTRYPIPTEIKHD